MKSENNLDERMEFRIDSKTKAKLIADAKMCHMTVGQYLRILIITHSPVTYLTKEANEFMDELHDCYNAMKNAHNEFARHMNAETNKLIEATTKAYYNLLNILTRKINGD